MEPVVHGIAETRAQLTALVRSMVDDPTVPPVFFGHHRKPQVVLVPHGQFVSTRQGPSLALLRAKLGAIRTIAISHGFSTGWVIGSVARGEASETSDVDLLCESHVDTSLYDVAGFEAELEQVLDFPVNVLTKTPGQDDEFQAGAVLLWS